MSGRNILVFQQLCDPLRGQLAAPRPIGPDERQPDRSAGLGRLRRCRTAVRDSDPSAFRQRQVAFQDHDTIVDSALDFHADILPPFADGINALPGRESASIDLLASRPPVGVADRIGPAAAWAAGAGRSVRPG
jgi:hypothetical protein